MTVKQKIIEQVNSIEDESILKQIYNLIAAEKKYEKIYKFSPSELLQVKEGMEDADNGRSYQQKESEKLIAKWLKEKSDGL